MSASAPTLTLHNRTMAGSVAMGRFGHGLLKAVIRKADASLTKRWVRWQAMIRFEAMSGCD